MEAFVRVTPEQLGIDAGLEYDRKLDFDLGNLAACDPSPIDVTSFREDTEAACLDLAARGVQSLFGQLFALPTTSANVGTVVSLPEPTTLLPRAKPCPKPKPLTKWEKFRQERGIQKRKRSSLVLDENTQQWKRRHGYGKANDELDTPIIEASADDKPGEDPWTRIHRERKEKMSQNKTSRKVNLADAAKAGAVPSTVKLSVKLNPNSMRGQISKGKALSADIKNASYLAGVSTASMGKFDKRLKGEKVGERKLPGFRQKHISATDTQTEKAAAGNVMAKVLRGNEGDLINMKRAVNKFEARERDKKRAGGEDGEDGSSKRKKGRVGRVKNRRVPKKAAPAVKKGGVKKGGKKGRK